MSRRKPQSPLTAIIEFFMAAPIAQAQSGLEAAQAVVASRQKTAAPFTANVPAARRRPAPAPAPTANTVTPVAPAGAAVVQRARQRAVRSDAGHPRQTAPVRHRRPPVDAADAAPLPDSYVPDGADEA